jgi:hypothetical protein
VIGNAVHVMRICLANNAAERALRGIAVGRKSWPFAGSDCGGERAAVMYTLIQAARLNDVDPQAWLADVLARIITSKGSTSSCPGTGRAIEPVARLDLRCPSKPCHHAAVILSTHHMSFLRAARRRFHEFSAARFLAVKSTQKWTSLGQGDRGISSDRASGTNIVGRVP